MISEQTREKLRIAAKNSYTDELLEVRRQAMIKLYFDPKERELQSQRMKLALNNSETSTRMSEGQKNRVHPQSQYAKMLETRLGFQVTDETKEKLREKSIGNTSHLGHKHTLGTIEKMREKRKEYWGNFIE